MIVEWNQHIFSPNTAAYPLHERAAYRPDMSRHPIDPLGAYIQHMRAEGIDRAIIVHPEPYGDDHRLMVLSAWNASRISCAAPRYFIRAMRMRRTGWPIWYRSSLKSCLRVFTPIAARRCTR